MSIEKLKAKAKCYYEYKKLIKDDVEFVYGCYNAYLNKILNAGTRNIEFKLSFKKFIKLRKVKKCMYSGVKFTCNDNGKMTMERVDPNKGYTNKNTIVCTARINSFKSNISEKELLSLYKFLKKRKD